METLTMSRQEEGQRPWTEIRNSFHSKPQRGALESAPLGLRERIGSRRSRGSRPWLGSVGPSAHGEIGLQAAASSCTRGKGIRRRRVLFVQRRLALLEPRRADGRILATGRVRPPGG
jgi:hypothetical protein